VEPLIYMELANFLELIPKISKKNTTLERRFLASVDLR